jgi:hypothetical protein
MAFIYQRVLAWFIICSVFAGGGVAYADKIFLKDGTVQESARVWQSQAYVHFILEGTQGVEIRYAREIVERVQINGVEAVIGIKTTESETPLQKQSVPKKMGGLDRAIAAPPGEAKSPMTFNIIDDNIVSTHKGLEFYDPHRDQRYWASRNSKHSSLNNALNALAQIYGRSVAWVETHMGAENDLGIIHRNLLEAHEKESARVAESVPAQTQPVMPIPSPQVVETRPESVADTVEKGLEFYNPRRKEKYWTGKANRYDSLDEALRSLAQQYGVTVEWIDRHMGHTNNLAEIHQNIVGSLKK